MTAIQFEDPAGDVVEEVAVVRDRDDRPGVLLEVLFEPRHGFRVEMVRRLVEQQDVGLLQQQTAERDTPFFAAGQDRHRCVGRRTSKRIHRHLKPRIQVPRSGGIELFLNLALAFEQLRPSRRRTSARQISH